MLPSTGEPGHTGLIVHVVIVDDQAPFRAAARAVVQRVPQFELVGEAESGEQAVEMAAAMRPELVLMDINMGGIDGIEATRRITAERPETCVILVSTYGVDELPPGARTSGAAAYLNKEDLTPKVIGRLWEAGGDPAWRSP